MRHTFLLCLLFSVVACSSTPTRTCPTVARPAGFAISPIGFPVSYDRLGEFWVDIRNFEQSGVLWNGLWREDAEQGRDAGSVPEAPTTLVRQGKIDCFQTSVVFGWREGTTLYIRIPDDPTNSWRNDTAKYRFREMLKTFASLERPSNIFLGNENDFYYEQDELDYPHWIEFYNRAYEDIKSVSPTTLVGPIFNYEHLSGTGTNTGWTRPLWSAIDQHDFSHVDLVGITLYPFFRYTSPAAIPSGYLDPLVPHLQGKPFAVTETGWPSERAAGTNDPWLISEAEQTNYIPKLEQILRGKNVSFQNWLFFNAMVNDGSSSDEWKTFGSISLRNQMGLNRQAHDVWVETFLN